MARDAGNADAFARRIRLSVGFILEALLLKVLLALLGAMYLAQVARTVLAEHASGLYRAQALQLHAARMTGFDRELTVANAATAAAGRSRLEFERDLQSLAADVVATDERRLLGEMLQLETAHPGAMEGMRAARQRAAAQAVYAQQVARLGAQLQDRLGDFAQRRRQRFEEARAWVDGAVRLVATAVALLPGVGVLAGLAIWAVTRRALARIERDDARLRTLIATRDEFIAAVAHELRTPLSVLRLSVDLLNRRAIGSPDRPVEVPAPALAVLERNVAVVSRSLIDCWTSA